jgi:hypothetical protein
MMDICHFLDAFLRNHNLDPNLAAARLGFSIFFSIFQHPLDFQHPLEQRKKIPISLQDWGGKWKVESGKWKTPILHAPNLVVTPHSFAVKIHTRADKPAN